MERIHFDKEDQTHEIAEMHSAEWRGKAGGKLVINRDLIHCKRQWQINVKILLQGAVSSVTTLRSSIAQTQRSEAFPLSRAFSPNARCFPKDNPVRQSSPCNLDGIGESSLELQEPSERGRSIDRK